MNMAMHVKLYQHGANESNSVIIHYIHNANELTFISLFLKVTPEHSLKVKINRNITRFLFQNIIISKNLYSFH